MTTAKIDGNTLHLFPHPPQIILGDITVRRKMDITPDSAKQHNKSVLFRRNFFSNITCKFHRNGQQLCPIQR